MASDDGYTIDFQNISEDVLRVFNNLWEVVVDDPPLVSMQALMLVIARAITSLDGQPDIPEETRKKTTVILADLCRLLIKHGVAKADSLHN